MHQRARPFHIFENVSSDHAAKVSFHIHDTVRKALLLVEPLRHVTNCRGEKHSCTNAIKRSKADGQLEGLSNVVSGMYRSRPERRRTVVAKAPPRAERKHKIQPAHKVSFRCTG